MKKLLILFAAISLIGCNKEDPVLSKTEQEIENAKLVGTWWRVQSSGKREYRYVFTEDFKVSSDNGIWYRYNEAYAIPQRGVIDLTMRSTDHIQYRFEDEYLFITDWVYVEYASLYELQTKKYQREE